MAISMTFQEGKLFNVYGHFVNLRQNTLGIVSDHRKEKINCNIVFQEYVLLCKVRYSYF